MLENELNAPRKLHPVISIPFMLFLAGLGFIAGSFVGISICLPFYDGTESELMAAIQNIEKHPELKFVLLSAQVCAAIAGLFFAPFIFLKIQQWPANSLFRTSGVTTLILVVTGLAVFFSFGLNSLFMEWNQSVAFPKEFEEFARKMEDTAARQTKILTTFDSVTDLLIGLLVIAVLPAVGEELVFRGILQNEFYRGTRNMHVAIWVTAIVFSAFHFQFYGFVPRMVLGALFGYLYYWSGSLPVAMFGHFVNNAVQVIALYYYQRGTLEFDLESTESVPLHFVIISAVITAGLLYYFYQHFRKSNPTPSRL